MNERSSTRFSKRKILLGAGLLILVVGGYPAVRQARLAYYLGAGRTALQEGEFDEARQSLEAAYRLKPDQAEVRYRLAVLNRRTGKLTDINRHLKKAEELGWPRDDVVRQRLLLGAQLGRFHDVERRLRQMIVQGTHDEAALEIYEALSYGYYANQQIDEALRALNFWINWRPRDVEPRLMRAELYGKFNDPVSSKKEYEGVLQIDPQHGLASEMMGRLLLDEGKVEEAEKFLRTSAQSEAPRPTVFLYLAQCAYRSGDAERSAEWLARIDEDEMPPENRVEVFKLRADIARYDRDPERAAEVLNEALKFWPHDSSVHESLGQIYSTLGLAERAKHHLDLGREIYDRAQRFLELQRQVVRQPNDPELRFEIAAVLEKQGLGEDAATWWQSALRIDPMHQASHEALVSYFERAGEQEQADRHRQLALACGDATFQRAWLALRREDTSEVVRHRALLERIPDRAPQVRLLEVALLHRQNKLEEAAAVLGQFEGPVEGQPALDRFVRLLRGEWLVHQGRLLAAEPLLKAVVQQDPDEILAHRWLSVIYYDVGAAEHARTHLLEVSRLAPADYRPHRLLGLMNKDYEVYDEAILHYQEALARHPQMPPREEVLLELAECQTKQREFDEALATLEVASPSVQRDVLRADCLHHIGRTDEAVPLLDAAISKEPEHLQALVLRADVALLRNETPQAVELLGQAVEKHPHDFTARRRYAQALARLGQDERSRQELEKSEGLKSLRTRFAKLHQEAIDKPYDIAVRRQLAKLAVEFGREDLAKIWNAAAAVLETGPPPEKSAADGSDDSGSDESRESADSQNAPSPAKG